MPGDDKPVLIAYDGSEGAKQAVDQAAAELRTSRKAIVVAVYSPLGVIPFWGAPAARVPNDWMTDVEKAAEATADEGAQLATAAGLDATGEVREGVTTWQAILDAASDLDAGLIVLGSHGRGTVGSAVLGSVATAVAHHADLPVLICRPHGRT